MQTKTFSKATMALAALPLTAIPALAQQPTESGDNSIVPVLMFTTFGLVIALAIIALASFLRKRSNREAFDRSVNPNHPANK